MRVGVVGVSPIPWKMRYAEMTYAELTLNVISGANE